MAKDIYDEWREWQAQRDAQKAADEDAIRAGKYQGAAADMLRDDLLYEAATPGTSNLTGKVSSGVGKATADKGDAVWNGVRDLVNNTPDLPDTTPVYYGGGGGTQTTTAAAWDPQLPSFSYENAPEYVSRYQGLIDEYLGRVLNPQAFSYNYETDPLYQQYAKSYGDAGRRAMQDTLAQISARTGGIASSYAGSASQQAYNTYMARLADKVPELQQLAYSMYNDELDRDAQRLSALRGLEGDDYGRYADRLGQYNTDRSFAYGVYGDERDNALSLAQLAASMGDYRGLKALGIDTNTAEAKARGGGGGGSSTSKSDARSRYEAYLKMGGSLDNLDPELLEATGLTPAELLAYASYYANQGTETADPFADMPYFQSETEANNWLTENGVPKSAVYGRGESSAIMDKREWQHYKSAYPSAPESAYTYYEDYVNDMARLAAINFGAIK